MVLALSTPPVDAKPYNAFKQRGGGVKGYQPPFTFHTKCIGRSDTNLANLALAIAGIGTPSKPK
jgi:hypothetical protein